MKYVYVFCDNFYAIKSKKKMSIFNFKKCSFEMKSFSSNI